MIEDLIKDRDRIDKTTEHKPKAPTKPMTVHTIMNDMRRWYEGNVFFHSDYKIDKDKYLILKKYYDEKEGETDDGK